MINAIIDLKAEITIALFHWNILSSLKATHLIISFLSIFRFQCAASKKKMKQWGPARYLIRPTL